MKFINDFIKTYFILTVSLFLFVGCGGTKSDKEIINNISGAIDVNDYINGYVDNNISNIVKDPKDDPSDNYIPDENKDEPVDNNTLDGNKNDENTDTPSKDSDQSDVNIVINTPPIVKEQTVSITSEESKTVIFDILKNVTDTNGDELNVISVTQKDSNSLNGAFSFDKQNLTITAPNVNIPTYYMFEAKVADSKDLNVTYDINLTVTDINDDAKLTASAVNAETNIAIGEDMDISMELSDADGIKSVTYNVYEKSDTSYNTALLSGILQDTLFDGDYKAKISSSSLQEGNYTAVIEAQGYIGGEYEDSSAVKIHYFNMVTPDLDPDAFDFPDIYSTPVNTYATTETLTISGINLAVTAKTTNGTLIINGVDTNLSTYSVKNKDTIAVRVLSPATYQEKLWTTVTIGEKSDLFGLLQAPLVMW